jgi:hypothetical protein
MIEITAIEVEVNKEYNIDVFDWKYLVKCLIISKDSNSVIVKILEDVYEGNGGISNNIKIGYELHFFTLSELSEQHGGRLTRFYLTN